MHLRITDLYFRLNGAISQKAVICTLPWFMYQPCRQINFLWSWQLIKLVLGRTRFLDFVHRLGSYGRLATKLKIIASSVFRFEVFMPMKMWIVVFWVVTQCSLVGGHHCFRGMDPEDRGSTFLWNLRTLTRLHGVPTQNTTIHKSFVISFMFTARLL
jgi:hypothetical protein